MMEEDPRSRTPSFIPIRESERRRLSCDRHVHNRIIAKVIPVLLVGAAGFSTWVYIAQLCGSPPFPLGETDFGVVNFLIKTHGEVALGGMSPWTLDWTDTR